MAKGALAIIVVAVVLGGIHFFGVPFAGLPSLQSRPVPDEAVEAQTLAQRGYGALSARIHDIFAARPTRTLPELAVAVNGPDGRVAFRSRKGGYEARMRLTSPITYEVISEGRFGSESATVSTPRIDGSVGGDLFEPTLLVTRPSQMTVTVVASRTGYCAGLYLTRWSADSSSDATLEPELLLPPDTYRDGTVVRYRRTFEAGTRVSLLLGVDADYNCEKRNARIPASHWTYEYVRPSIIAVERLRPQEGKYALIEPHPRDAFRWRIGFEDQIFSDAKLADVKQNGYGTAQWSRGTYGGAGWTERDSTGYLVRKEFAHMPDFNDHLFEVVFTPEQSATARR